MTTCRSLNIEYLLKYCFFGLICCLSSTSIAQNESTLVEDSIVYLNSESDLIWDMSFELKTMNVFRGLLPSNSTVFSTQAGVKYRSLILGFYGGSSTNGVYTETDLILMYYRPRFNARFDYYYNFTQGITNIPNPSGFFDLDPETTRGLLDFIFNYQLGDHLKFTSSTFVFGRDRPATDEDLENDIQLRRGDQRYSQYLSLQYSWYWDDSKVSAHAGGAFSWTDPSAAHFYGDRAGFNDIGITFYKKLIATENVSIPIKAAITLNPLSNNLYLVAGIQLIEISKLK